MNKMATITVTITIQQTVPALTGAVVDATLAWINTNIVAKLPPSATATIAFSNIAV